MGFNDDSNNFITFTTSIGYVNSFYESVSENIDIDDEGHDSNNNKDLQEAYNKTLWNITFKKLNAKLTKNIKKLMKDQE